MAETMNMCDAYLKHYQGFPSRFTKVSTGKTMMPARWCQTWWSSEFYSSDPCGRRRERISVSCPLTSIHVPWHMPPPQPHAHKHPRMLPHLHKCTQRIGPVVFSYNNKNQTIPIPIWSAKTNQIADPTLRSTKEEELGYLVNIVKHTKVRSVIGPLGASVGPWYFQAVYPTGCFYLFTDFTHLRHFLALFLI